MAALGFIVLLFQALLLAHGGVTTLGANTFSMAIAGPFIAYFVYVFCKKIKLNRSFSIFLAASLGNLLTYIITSFQLALAHPDTSGGIFTAFYKFLGVFAVTQIPLAVSEGLLTVLIINMVSKYAKEEMSALKVYR